MTSVLHVVPAAAQGGGLRAVRNLIATDELAAYDHEVVSLRPVDSSFRASPEAADMPLSAGSGVRHARERMGAADLVHVHFWNTPELYELIRGPLPPARVAVWTHVGGDSDPQWVGSDLAEFADRLVATCAHTASLSRLSGSELSVIEPLTDPERRRSISARPERSGLAVGYIGTVDPTKMHPEFIELCLDVDAPDARFVVCGAGGGFAELERRAEAAGAADRFDLRGYADASEVLAGLDVFGYPLCPDNYAANDLVLQEAMFAGVPPVILPYGGCATTVVDDVTGIVAGDEAAYSAAVSRLCRDPELRARLGANAQRHAAERWTPAVTAAAWRDLYADLLEHPKRDRSSSGPAPVGAEALIEGLGPWAETFRASVAGDPGADRAIAAAPPAIGWAAGGVLEYRQRYPDDVHLRLWSGLALAARGRRALAAGELRAAVDAGIDPGRVEGPMAELVGAAG